MLGRQGAARLSQPTPDDANAPPAWSRSGSISSQAKQPNDSGGLNITRAFTPRKDALAAIPELEQVRRATQPERLQQALDNVQCALLKALESNDPRQRLSAARIMLKTKQGRERGFRT